MAAIFTRDRFIYRVDGFFEKETQDLEFKNATLYASGIMLADQKVADKGYKTNSGFNEISKGKRLTINKLDLVTIMEI